MRQTGCRLCGSPLAQAGGYRGTGCVHCARPGLWGGRRGTGAFTRKQTRHGPGTDTMPLPLECRGQVPSALACPAQRGHGVPPGGRLDQGLQGLDHGRIGLDDRAASASRAPATRWRREGQLRGVSEFRHPASNGMTRKTWRVDDGSNTPLPQRLGFCGGPVPAQPLAHERLQGLKFLFECFNHHGVSHAPNATHQHGIVHIAPCGRTLQPYPLDQGPARGALEAYVPRLILSPSS
jgi:hypothetical protein